MVDIENPFLGKMQARQQKHKNFAGGAQEINFGFFFNTLILSFWWHFPERKPKNHIFPAVLGIVALR